MTTPNLTDLQREIHRLDRQRLRNAFLTRWKQLGGPELTEEFRFHPVREWRFDFCHEPSRVAIEVEGGTFSAGAHVRGVGYSKDCQKYNAAQVLGWKVFRLTTDMINGGDPAGHLEPIIKLCRGEA